MSDREAPFARPAERLHIEISHPDPRSRGEARGTALRTQLPAAIDAYDRIFAAGGIAPEAVRDDAHRTLDLVAATHPGMAEQLAGIAAGAGVEEWRIAALNTRTEILARSRLIPPGECSTIVAPLPPAGGFVGVQTWDWHVELAAFWHTIGSGGGRHRHVGLTEHGIIAKIGVNSAGVALHFNILGHQDDGAGGIPMHLLAALVLEEADSVEHALDIVRSARIRSSSSFALLEADRAVLLDISPAGVFEVPAIDGRMRLRTNHFLTPAPAADEKAWLYQPESGDRFELLAHRLAASAPATQEELLGMLVTGPGEPAVTCLPDYARPLGLHWASLATVLLDPDARTAHILDGTPAEQETRPWYRLTA